MQEQFGVKGGGEGGGGNVNPSSYVLREMEKTNIWPSAAGYGSLNGCAAGRKRCTLAIAEVPQPAKCDNLYKFCVSANDWLCVRASASLHVCVCVFYFLD